MNRLLAVLLAFAALLASACGERDPADSKASNTGSGDTQLSDRLVDFGGQPPFVNDLGVDPATGDFLLTTNRGFWRISADGKEVMPIKGTVSSDGKQAPLGTFLAFELLEGGDMLLGSGHPDSQQPLPQFLGLIRSEDMGKTWTVVSRLGEADLHKIVEVHDRLYMFDAVLGAMLISEDGGRTFRERFTPRGLVIDFAIDPEDPEYLLAATEDQLFKSEDEGRGWRPLEQGEGFRLAWPAPGKLYRADKDGTIRTSGDRGATWQEVGKVPGEPYRFHEITPDELLLALSDGTIMETNDGGKTWVARFEP